MTAPANLTTWKRHMWFLLPGTLFPPFIYTQLIPTPLQIFTQMPLPQWNLHWPPNLKCQPCLIPLTTTQYSLNLLSNHAFIFLQSIYHHLIHLYFIHYIFYLIILFIICFPTPSEHNFHIGRDFWLTKCTY